MESEWHNLPGLMMQGLSERQQQQQQQRLAAAACLLQHSDLRIARQQSFPTRMLHGKPCMGVTVLSVYLKRDVSLSRQT